MRIRKTLALAVACIMALTALTGCSSSGSITKPALVSKVTRYDIDYDTGDWYEVLDTEFEYENAYPVSIKEYDVDSDETSVRAFKYEFDGEMPVKAHITEAVGQTKEVSYTEEGYIDRILETMTDGFGTYEQIYQYGNRDRYFTLVLHERVMINPDEPDEPDEHMEEVDSVMIDTKDGLLVKTVNDGIFANYAGIENKKWERFDGSYTANYDGNGIVSETYAEFQTFPNPGPQLKFDITIEDGRVTEVVRNHYSTADSEEGSWVPEQKFVFEYTDVEIDAARYASMINYFAMDAENNYYFYHWY